MAAEAGHPELEALQVFRRVDRLAEPAAALGAGLAGDERAQAEDFAQLGMQRLTAAGIVPGHQLGRGHPEGHGGEEGEGRVLADEVVIGGVIHVGLAGDDGIEALQAGAGLVGALGVDGELSVGDVGDAFGEAGNRIPHARQADRPAGDHGQSALALGVERRGQRRGGGRGGAADGGFAQE